MIFYFSGTGNSSYVAHELATRLNDRLIPIADALLNESFDYSLGPNERIGWVFPTYAWGPPTVVMNFIAHFHVDGYTPTTYCYMVTTCGDDIGEEVDIWRKALGDIDGKAAFSITMPNIYICMKGFDVDSDLVEKEKINSAKSRIDEIALSIASGRCSVEVNTGKWKWLKSHLFRSWFLRHAMSDRPFYADDELCSHCRACVTNCPMHNITMSDDAQALPQWNGNCTMCLSCIHHCPTRAIQYGNKTQNKGRYYFKG
jgi:NAD-dependent dihydropyrimidine dehydrogenase PreA subunit/flavodoxin